MIVPNKFIPFEASILSKLELVLKCLGDETGLSELFKKTEKHFDGIDQFMFTIDVLFILGRINLDPITRAVKHAERNF